MTEITPSRRCSIGVMALFSLIAFLIGAYVRHRFPPESLPGIPHVLFRETVPVAIDIEYRPNLSYRDGCAQASGIARYKFTNLTDAPIHVSFPPHRVFGIQSHCYTPDWPVPSFAVNKRHVAIPSNGSVTFESLEEKQFIGDIRHFLEGGPGWIGFVFSTPGDSTGNESFCVGTVIPQYRVIPVESKSTQ